MRSRSSSRIERIRQLECEREREREREAMQETIKRLTSTGVESTHELERETMQEVALKCSPNPDGLVQTHKSSNLSAGPQTNTLVYHQILSLDHTSATNTTTTNNSNEFYSPHKDDIFALSLIPTLT